MQLIKGLAYIKSTKISKYLFSHLSKYGILIRDRITSLNSNVISNLKSNYYDFFISDYLAIKQCSASMRIDIPNKFMLIYDTNKTNYAGLIEDCKFIPILAYPLSINLIAHQIINHFQSMHNYINMKNLAFKDSALSTIRITFAGRAYFVFTIIPDGGYLEYKGLSVRLSSKEANIMEQLIYAFRESVNTCVEFNEYSFKQITNGISRLRMKLVQIKLPFTISNRYGGGYCLKYNSQKLHNSKRRQMVNPGIG